MTVAGALAAALAAMCLVLAVSGVLVVPLRRHPDSQALADIGWTRSLLLWEGLRVGVATGGGVIGLLLGVPPVITAALGALIPSFVARDRVGASRNEARRGVTRALLVAHGTLRSGAPLTEAIRQGRDAAGHRLARRPFDRALDAFALGEPLDRALLDAATQEPDERTRLALATLALGISERLSIERLAALVGAIADRSTFDDRLDEEVRARASGAGTQVRLLAVVVPGLALYLTLTTPGIAETLASPLGRTVLLPGALVLEVLGVVLSRRFVAEALR